MDGRRCFAASGAHAVLTRMTLSLKRRHVGREEGNRETRQAEARRRLRRRSGPRECLHESRVGRARRCGAHSRCDASMAALLAFLLRLGLRPTATGRQPHTCSRSPCDEDEGGRMLGRARVAACSGSAGEGRAAHGQAAPRQNPQRSPQRSPRCAASAHRWAHWTSFPRGPRAAAVRRPVPR